MISQNIKKNLPTKVRATNVRSKSVSKQCKHAQCAKVVYLRARNLARTYFESKNDASICHCQGS